MSVYITKYNWTRPDFQGGVTVRFNIVNLSGKTIDTAKVYFAAFDKSGAAAPCSVRNRNVVAVTVKDVPDGKLINHNSLIGAWYNKDVARVELHHLEVQFEDNSRCEIDAGQAAKAPADVMKRLHRVNLLYILGILAGLGAAFAGAAAVFMHHM